MAQDERQAMMPFIGFAPDIDPTEPGIWLDCDGLIGTTKGFRPEPGDLLAFATVGGTFLLYDRDQPTNVYAVAFTDFITVAVSNGPAAGGITLNEHTPGNRWNIFIQDGVMMYDDQFFGDTIPWDDPRPFLVNNLDPQLQLNYGL